MIDDDAAVQHPELAGVLEIHGHVGGGGGRIAVRARVPIADEPFRRGPEVAMLRAIAWCLDGQRLGDRKSVVEGKRVSVRVDLGGWRNIKKQKKQGKTLRI